MCGIGKIRKTAFSLLSPPRLLWKSGMWIHRNDFLSITAGVGVCKKYANSTSCRYLYYLQIGYPTRVRAVSYNHAQHLEEEISEKGYTLREKLFKSCKAFPIPDHWEHRICMPKKTFTKRCAEDWGPIPLGQG